MNPWIQLNHYPVLRVMEYNSKHVILRWKKNSINL